MVEHRIYTEILLREKRCTRRSDTKKRLAEQVQKRVDDGATERARLAIEDLAQITANASTRVLDNAVSTEQIAASTSIQALRHAIATNLYNANDYRNGREGYSDVEDYEDDNNHLVPDEDFAFQIVPTTFDFK
jgi:hypothetical protein